MPMIRPAWDKPALKALDASLGESLARAATVAPRDIKELIYATMLGAADPAGKTVRGSWASAIGTPSSVSFAFSVPTESGPWDELSYAPAVLIPEQVAVAREALWQIEQICGLSFTETTDANATLRFGNFTGLSHSYQPAGFCPPGSAIRNSDAVYGDVWISHAAADPGLLVPPKNADAFTTILHEIAHAVGLDHSTADPTASPRHPLDNTDNTVMTIPYGVAASYRPCDVIALRHLYGPGKR